MSRKGISRRAVTKLKTTKGLRAHGNQIRMPSHPARLTAERQANGLKMPSRLPPEEWHALTKAQQHEVKEFWRTFRQSSI